MGSVASMPPTSTMLTGHGESEIRVVACNGAYLATCRRRSRRRGPPADGLDARLARRKLSPSRPSRAGNAPSRDVVASESKPRRVAPLRRPRDLGSASLRDGPRPVGPGCLAGETVDHPLMGTSSASLLTDTDAAASLRSRPSPASPRRRRRPTIAADPTTTRNSPGAAAAGTGRPPAWRRRARRGHQHEQQDDERLDGMAADHGGQTTNRAVRGPSSRAGIDGVAGHPRGYPCRSWTNRR